MCQSLTGWQTCQCQTLEVDLELMNAILILQVGQGRSIYRVRLVGYLDWWCKQLKLTSRQLTAVPYLTMCRVLWEVRGAIEFSWTEYVRTSKKEMYTISLQFPNRTPVPIYGHIIISRFSLATILHLWLLVMQPHKRQLYGGIFDFILYNEMWLFPELSLVQLSFILMACIHLILLINFPFFQIFLYFFPNLSIFLTFFAFLLIYLFIFLSY